MQIEGIVHVLRHLYEGLAPGGQVVDLQAVEPSGRVEVDGCVLGLIDDTVFFRRARVAVAGLDVLVDEGLLVRGGQVEFDTLVYYDTGPELVAAIADSTEWQLPVSIAARLADRGQCVVRERSLVRVLRRPPPLKAGSALRRALENERLESGQPVGRARWRS
jgi:hypothetical protein